jgi:hypothetical protein
MAYSKELAQRIQATLLGKSDVVQREMFGGIGFLLNGNMACGVIEDELIVRVGLEGYQDALISPFTETFDYTGYPMKGWIVVTPQGYEGDDDLITWVMKGVEFAESLPVK